MNSFVPAVILNSQDVEEGQVLDGGQKQPVNTISCSQQQFQRKKLSLVNFQHLFHNLLQAETVKLTHEIDLKSNLSLPFSSDEIIYETVADKNCSNDEQDRQYDKKKKKIYKNQQRDEPNHKKHAVGSNREVQRNCNQRYHIEKQQRQKPAQKYQQKNSYYHHENADHNNNKNTIKNTTYQHQMLPSNYYPPHYSYPVQMHQAPLPQMYPPYPMYPPYLCHNQPYPYHNHIMPHQMPIHPPYPPHGEIPPHMNYNYPPKISMPPPVMMDNYKLERKTENGFKDHSHSYSPPPQSYNYTVQYSPNIPAPSRSCSNASQNNSPGKPNKKNILQFLKHQLKNNLHQYSCDNKCEILEALRHVLSYTAKRNQTVNQSNDPIEKIQTQIQINCYKQSLTKIEFWLEQDKTEQSRSYLTHLISKLQIDISSEIRQNKDAKKMENDSKQSEMKRMLDILVRDPRKIVF